MAVTIADLGAVLMEPSKQGVLSPHSLALLLPHVTVGKPLHNKYHNSCYLLSIYCIPGNVSSCYRCYVIYFLYTIDKHCYAGFTDEET